MKVIDAFISKNAAKLLWLAAGILIAFIFLQQCKGRKQADLFRQWQAQAKALEAKVKADSIARNEERKVFAREKQEAEGKRELAVVEKQEADKRVQLQQKTIDRLVGDVRNSVWVTNSTEPFAVVTPQYKAACDSLPAQIDMLNLALADRDTALNAMLDLYDYEIQIRDEEIFKEMNYSDSLKADFNRQTALLKQALNTGKPRGRLLGGISVLGNENQFLSGAGVVIAYQTKGGKQYQVSPKFIKVPGGTAQAYYEGTVLFTIFK